MNKHALVTGGTGFIGEYLVRLLIKDGYTVRIFSGGSTKVARTEFIEIALGDLRDIESLNRACSEIDVVFHLAGIAHAGTRDEGLLKAVNVEGTRNLVNACLSQNVTRLVYLSSVLAEQTESNGKDVALSMYGRSKKQAEDIILESNSNNFEACILRSVNVYGPGMKGNIAGMIRRIKAGSLPPLPKLDHNLSLVGVEDLCRAALIVAESDAAVGNIYTISDGAAYTPNGIEEAIYSALGRKKPDWHTPRMVFYAAALVAQTASFLGLWKNDLGLRTYRNLIGQDVAQGVSCEKITTELGYRPSQTFFDMLPDIVERIDSELTS